AGPKGDGGGRAGEAPTEHELESWQSFKNCLTSGWTRRTRRPRVSRHKGLAKFFETGSKAGVQAQHAERLRLILGRLSAATSPHDMALPGLSLHPLGGDRKGTWAVSVSGNWRVTFKFVGKDADAVDYEDYHCGTRNADAQSTPSGRDHQTPFPGA